MRKNVFFAGLVSACGVALVAATATGRADQASVVDSCSNGGNAGQLVSGYLNELRASGADTASIDQAVSDLTVALGNKVLQGSGASRASIAACIQAAAAAVSTAQQQEQLQQIATTILNDTGTTIPAVSASGI